MSENSWRLEILIVDDHALFRECVALALSAKPGFRVTHCASSAEAMQIIAGGSIDIVLLDYDLGFERGTAFLAGARQLGFAGKVLVVTAFVSDFEAQRLLREGVAGIFVKESPIELLTEAIRQVAAGGAWLDQRFLHLLADGEKMQGGDVGPRKLTERERRVLGFIFEGLANKEIAALMHSSEHSVKAVIQDLFRKTGARTRGQLVRAALERYQGQI